MLRKSKTNHPLPASSPPPPPEPVKHGLQTLGKIGVGRRVPPPANLPSSKSETTGKASTNASTVAVGGQQQQAGWTKPGPESTTSTPSTGGSSQTPAGPPAIDAAGSSFFSETNGQLTDSNNSATNVNVNSTSQSQRTASGPADTSPNRQSTIHSSHSSSKLSSLFSQDFPSLDGGSVQKSNSDTYGPGPSLRPQTGRNWNGSRPPAGSAAPNSNPNQPPSHPPANQPPNAGSYVNGQPHDPNQPPPDDHLGAPRAYHNTAQQPRGMNKSNGYNRNPNYNPQQQQRYGGQFNNQNQFKPNQRHYDRWV